MKGKELLPKKWRIGLAPYPGTSLPQSATVWSAFDCAWKKKLTEFGFWRAWQGRRNPLAFQFMQLPFIDLQTSYQRSKAEVDAAIQRVLNHGQFILGPEVAELERTLADYVGVKHCVSVASGTDSLEIALRAADIGPGDDVITVPFTWISTAEVVAQVGARTRFVDIEPDSYNLNPDLLDGALTPATKAIIPVGLFGQPANMEAINAFAGKHGLLVIEDAAQSFGSTRHGKRSCALAPVASTSFFPAKPLGCYGDGGALFTDDDGHADKFRAIRNHGGLVRNHHTLVGMNGRFDTLQAAIMLAKWQYFAEEVEARQRIGARYSSLLQDVCMPPAITPGNSHVYAQYTIRVPDREALGAALKEQGIPTAVYYPLCLHEQPVFASCGYRHGDFPEAERAAAGVISLPMHPHLDEVTQDRIVEAVKAGITRG
jgi:UDP-2-acetamido-2-deoxy-ribo-hexuluronate aminotransferase